MPYRYILLFLVFLSTFWCQTAIAQLLQDSTLEKQTKAYHVHLGTYQKLIPSSYFKQAGLGKVKHHKDGNNFHRYYLGFIDSKSKAQKKCEKAIKEGFPNAKIVTEEEDEITKILKEKKRDHKFIEVTYDELFLKSVLFDFNSARLDQPAQQLIHETYLILVRNPEWIVQLSGHSDSVGSPESNIKISKTRVRAVKNRLLEYGIQPHRIKTRVFGEAAPMAKNREKTGEDVPSGRQLNRRVSIGIYNENGEMVKSKDSTIVPFDAQLGH